MVHSEQIRQTGIRPTARCQEHGLEQHACMACGSLAYPTMHRSWHAWHAGRLHIPPHTGHGASGNMHGM
eukprot:scaffold52820_cov19-Tisochrysis_lutea.AAC.1